MLTEASQHRCESLLCVTPRARSQSDADLYRDLARASGGQLVEVTKSDLSLATSIIEDLSANALVRQPTSKPYLSMRVNMQLHFLFLSGDSFSGREESRRA